MKYLIVLFLFFSTAITAQEVKVIDKQTGKTVKNVNVFNTTQTINLTSNNKGFVSLSDFKNTDIVVFSHLSYAILELSKSKILSKGNIVYLTKASEQLDEIVLSLFKKEAKTKRIAEEIAVLNTKQIQELAPQTSADLLANVPGIKVQKSQFGGGSPVIRGMESNRVLLVVDGVRMNNAIYRKGHLQNAITVAPNMLDKTEIVFGPSSVIYGSDALGGVVHYYTKTPRIAEKKEVKSQFFSQFSSVNQEVTTAVSAELRFKNWASFTSISYSAFGDLMAGKNRVHGFENWGKTVYFSENTATNYSASPTLNTNSNLQKNTGYNQTDILQKFFIPLNSNLDLKFNLQYSTSSNIPRFDRLSELTDLNDTSSLKFAEWYYGPQQRLLLSSQLDIQSHSRWLETGTLTAAYQNVKESRVQRRFTSLNRSYREEAVDIFSLNGDFAVPVTQDKSRTLSYGFEFAFNKVNSNAEGKVLAVNSNTINGFTDTFNVQTRYPDNGSSYLSAAAYIGYRQDLNKKSTLNTGLRYTNTHLEANWQDQTFIQLANPNIKLDNSAITATLGYVYRPNKNWQLNSVLASGFRSPNIDDVGRIREKAGNVTVPNVAVKPEFAYNAEFGVKKFFNDKKFRLGANFYYTLLNNYIQRDFIFDENGAKTTQVFDGETGFAVSNQNKGTAYITGFTANYLGKISNAIETSGFITYTKGRTYDSKEPMSSIPPLFGQFNVNYSQNKLRVGAHVRFNAKKDITDFNITEGIDNHDLTPVVNANATIDLETYFGTPAWFTMGLQTAYTFNPHFSVQARLDNILDHHYIEFASGVASPGRNLSISLTAIF